MNEDEVRRLLDRLFDAWNRGDAPAFAALFSPEADYVTGEGEWVHGRAAIGALLAAAAASGPASLQGPPSVRLHDGAASAIFRWSAGPAGGIVSCVLERGPDGWLIERLHNTDRA